MAGNRNSGRKTAFEEHNKKQAINKLWEKVNRKIQSGEELSEFEEKLVHSVLPKTIKQEIGAEVDYPNGLLVKILSDDTEDGNNGDTEGV